MLSANKSRVFWLSPDLRQIVVRKAGNPPPNGGGSAEPDSGETVPVHAYAISSDAITDVHGGREIVECDPQADVAGRRADFSSLISTGHFFSD
jgi:hypothetical protein